MTATAVKLGVFADVNIKPFITGKQPALLTHAGIFAVDFGLAHAQRCRTRHRTEGKAGSRAAVLLPAVVIVGILQATDRPASTLIFSLSACAPDSTVSRPLLRLSSSGILTY